MEVELLERLEYNGKLILTTKQLAELYGTNNKVISKNFERNRERFIDGVHYHLLKSEDLSELREEMAFAKLIGPKVRNLYLWTEEGVLLHAKSIGTDQAWKAYSDLVKFYFTVRDNANLLASGEELSTELKIIQGLVNTLIDQEKRQTKLEETINVVGNMAQETKDLVASTREIVKAHHGAKWREETNKILNSVSAKIGDYKSPKDYVYGELSRRGKCNLSLRLSNLKDRCTFNGWAPHKVNKLNYLDVIELDDKLKEIYVAIVKEYAIAEGV